MNTGRRFFLSGAAAALAAGHALLTSAQRHDPSAQIPPFPGPGVPNAAPDDVPLPPRADPKTQLKEEQKELRRDVDRLLQMVKDLKEESDKTPETDVLSMSLVKKTEDIEKLARQIRDRIRAG
jgi:peptidoglycan hydrolase CwlO-like protein